METGIEKSGADAGGRPTKYKKEFNKLVYQLCLLGATDKQIADALNISVSTLNEWKLKRKGFSESLGRGKILADAKVAAGLYKRATGFFFDETVHEKIEIKDEAEINPGEGEADQEIKIDAYKKKVTTKYQVPDTGAALAWLKNRQKSLWREKQDIGLDDLSNEVLDMLIKKIKGTE